MDALGVLLLWVMLAGLVGAFASSRGRSGFGFFLLSAVLSPLLGFIAVLVMPDKAREDEDAARRRDQQALQLESVRAIAASAGAQPHNVETLSVADEISKLADLKSRGLLTEDEFAAQKAALLRLSA